MTAERQLAYWLVGFALLFALLFALGDILLPFILGFAIAYLLDPVADMLVRWRAPRWLAATLLTVVFLVGIAAFLMLLVPLLQSQLLDMAARLPHYAELLRAKADAVLGMVQAKMSPEDLAQLRDAFGGVAGNTVQWLGRMLSSLWSGGLALVNLISLIVITPVVAFYLLRDWDLIVARIDRLLPRQHAETIREQCREVDRMLSGFARGQALVCLLLGLFYGAGLTLIGLDFGLIIGLATGLISFVPYFGMLTGLAVGIGLAFAQFSDWLPIALVAGVFVVGQVIEGNVITPKLVGDRVGLHPVWMIFALLAGGALFGFVGILLAVPAAATVGVLARFGVARYFASALYGGGGGDGDRSGGS